MTTKVKLLVFIVARDCTQCYSFYEISRENKSISPCDGYDMLQRDP